MAKWHWEFDADGKHMEHIMELLTPLRVENMSCKIVAGTPTKIRAGDRPAWQIVAEAATDKPLPRQHFVDALRRAGFSNPAGITAAIEKRVISRKPIKGVMHYVRARGGK